MICQYSEALQDKEKSLLEYIEKWSGIEESMFKQKTRAKWIKLGDNNSSYFSAVMK